MPARELGNKYTCFKCGTRFYDLKKPEPLCPKCGADQRQGPVSKPSTAAEKRRAPAKPAPPPKPEVDEVEAEVDADDEAETDEDAEAEESDEP
ncbi:MAG TPA: FYDLN acid domain-containing protein [Anaeromyxobacter sp.]